MTEKLLFADSTVGFTVYNVLAMNVHPLNIDELHTVAGQMQHVGLKRDQVERCVNKLLELKRIKFNESGDKYSPCAQERFFVARRDMSDYNEKTMEGGWHGWVVKDPRGLMRPLESLLGLQPTGIKPRHYNKNREVRA